MQPKSREPGGDKGAWKTDIRPTNSSGPALLPALPFPFRSPPARFTARSPVAAGRLCHAHASPRRDTGCSPSPPSSSSRGLLPQQGLALTPRLHHIAIRIVANCWCPAPCFLPVESTPQPWRPWQAQQLPVLPAW